MSDYMPTRPCPMCGAKPGEECAGPTMRDVLDDGRPILDPAQSGIYTDNATEA